MTRDPVLSVVVIVHDMARQALNTLRSLDPAYQGVDPSLYEVIAVENRSSRVMDLDAIAALPAARLPGHLTHILRDEAGVSPAAAINAGLAQARGRTIGIMIDGARMLSPGVIRHVLMALRITDRALVAVPGYQLGPTPRHPEEERDPEEDLALLDRIGWPAAGYGLFDIASMSINNREGFFRPFMECNCLFAPSDVLADLGGADERFDLPGGGALNLFLYHRLAHHPRTELFVLPGEGSFHQSHGGVTTAPREDRDAFLALVRGQLETLLGQPFTSPNVPATFLGQVPPGLGPFLSFSAERFLRPVKRPKRPPGKGEPDPVASAMPAGRKVQAATTGTPDP
jgi:hypothetical protein